MGRALLIVMGLSLLCAAPALAQEEQAPRAVPDYDGRADPPPSAEEVLIWIPRLALAPLHLVLEYLVRRPLAAILSAIERERIHLFVVDVVTWDRLKAGLVPTVFFDFGLLPSVGLYFFWNDLGAPGHRIRANVGFGGVDYLRASVWDRVLLAREGHVELTLRVDATRRPDHAFQGLGAMSRLSDRARYRRDTLEAGAVLSIKPWRRSELRVAVEVGWNELDAEGYGEATAEPSLARAVQTGIFAALPAGMDGYVAYRQRVHLVIDSREEPPTPGHGLRGELLGEQAFDLRRPLERAWLRVGGAVAGFVDLGAERVVSLHVHAELVEPLGAGEIPFTEQVRLGGEMLRLGGFLQDQLIGRSAAVATLRYRYPVWTWLDAGFYASVGNVFDAQFRDFAFERLRLSFGFGLASVGDPDHALELSVGLGTSPFVSGGAVESVRLSLGARAGVF